MPLLQAAAARGLADPERTGPLLDGWSRFAVRHLLDETDAPRRGSRSGHIAPRLYDMPWLARFFHDRHRAHGREEGLERAARIIERRFDLSRVTHLSIDVSPAATAVCDALDTVGQTARAGRLRDPLVVGARRFARLARHLPAREVGYEQVIVAPLLDLLGDAYALTGDAVFHDAIEERLP
ncbi:hypothetical protein [Streptomyces sp. YIM B13518]|uniref:hypothetical protein n=1 Tax=Streptomyces sp. YIM B13518 TaxID=3366316 RepID=UPI0036DCA940